MASKGTDVDIVGFGSTIKTTLTGIGNSKFHPIYIPEFTKFVNRNVPQGTRQGTIISYKKEMILTYSQAEAGDNMGALLRGMKREQIRRGQVLAAPGTITAAKQFLAQIYVGLILFSLFFCH